MENLSHAARDKGPGQTHMAIRGEEFVEHGRRLLRLNPALSTSAYITSGLLIAEATLVQKHEEGGLKDILVHPNQGRYRGQLVLVVAYREYVFLVPSVEENDHYFLKTIIPSRKATRDYLGMDDSDEKA